MRRMIPWLLGLVLALAAASAAVYFALARTTDAWFERDLVLRSDLAVASASRSLLAHWGQKQPSELASVLNDITRDPRILGAVACSAEGHVLSASPDLADVPPCPERAASREPAVVETAQGRVRVSATPLRDAAGATVGHVVLVHDLAFIGRRQATTRNIVLGAFFGLSVVASALTLLFARLAWREWTRGLRDALAGRGEDAFRPLLRDVRALAETLAEEHASDARVGRWDAERLKATLRQHLHGERIVVVANREPYIHEHRGGEVKVLHPASGLVTALEPVMRACSGVWVAHGSGSADRETVDANDHVRVPPGEESYAIRRVWLTEEDEAGYYYGFSNEGLWPLCHVAHTRPKFRESDWERYKEVNRKFADAVCQEVDTDDPVVLVQDYHFALAPRMIRERIPRATILTFWHIPWPNAERMGICPWRDELVAGLLGSSIVGFHTQQHCNHFFDAVDTFLESRIDREHDAVVHRGHRSLVRNYPISIEWPVRWLAGIADAATCRREILEEVGLSPSATLGVGVDRLDYTKGIEERILAVDALLERHPEHRGRFVFVQLAAPSRSKIEKYQQLAERVEALVSHVNDRWGTSTYKPVVLRRAHHEPREVMRYFRAADLCYVSSLHDGMNLVAKEFVAAREDEAGVLVLSQFTGAARDLTEALIVNPYDIAKAGDALHAALNMPVAEQRERMRSMRRMVSELNVYRWAGRMLVDAAEVRRRERFAAKWSSSLVPGEA
ncbi:MAG: trehalose-6-phosphate synthase [Myxococcales bacterium]|nr:trehalose-6-phosphate synthase [Myxococcales bacterium]